MSHIPTPGPEATDPDSFRHVEAWVFDLDNTLYPAHCNLFAQVDRRIGEFIAERFGLSYEEARAKQKAYFRTYGTSLRGLMLEHDMDPVPFLEYVHDIDVTPIGPSEPLDQALAALPGRKLVYTNGSVRHAENILARLGIATRFDGIYDIVAADYVPKPDPRPYAEFVRRFEVDPSRAVMVEDIARNLVPAAALGMTTVWVRSEADWSRPDMGGVGHGDHIHHVVDDLEAWLGDLSTGLAGPRA
ncbi:pyrimidine 5'-nucleotidase [Aerophototrophica crusticola]|uniref:Pyrimidine 5'-nucleotidase n=1 Tax=Aerophototrophica crusticola TaxID=1709002 RepID=A0A858RA47_9PROT|nr:pyrimidine 5'-nucleotidase [Rhodospirillaceae bacterium B3]